MVSALVRIVVLVAVFLGIAASPVRATGDDMTPNELWALDKITHGEAADFNKRCDTPTLDYRVDDPRWRETCRELRPISLAALDTALVNAAIPVKYVIIKGSTFPNSIYMEGTKASNFIDMQDSVVEGNIIDYKSIFHSSFQLVRTRITKSIDFSHATFERELLIDSAQVADGDVDLNSSIIRGFGKISDSQVNGDLDGRGLEAGSNLQLVSSTFRSVDLGLSHISGSMLDAACIIAKDLVLNSARISDELLIHGVAQARPRATRGRIGNLELTGPAVDLSEATVGGSFEITDTQIIGSMSAPNSVGSITIIGSDVSALSLAESTVERGAIINASAIGSLDASGSTVKDDFNVNAHGGTPKIGPITLERANIEGGLIIEASIDGKLDLVNTRANSVYITNVVIPIPVSTARGRHPAPTPDRMASLDMSGGRYTGNVDLNGVFTTISASGVSVGGNVTLSGGTSHDPRIMFADLSGEDVRGSVTVIGAVFDGVSEGDGISFLGTKIGGDLNLIPRTPVSVDDADVGNDFKAVNLNGAQVANVTRIHGVRVRENLTLDHLSTDHLVVEPPDTIQDLPERRSRFRGMNLPYAKIRGTVVLRAIDFETSIDAMSVGIGSDLTLSDIKQDVPPEDATADCYEYFAGFNLRKAVVAGSVDATHLDHVICVDFDGSKIGGHLSMINSQVTSLNGSFATAGSYIKLDDSIIKNNVNLNSIEVRSLWMRESDKNSVIRPPQYGHINLADAVVSEVEFSGARLTAGIYGNGIRINNYICLDSISCPSKNGNDDIINLKHIYVERVVNLDNARCDVPIRFSNSWIGGDVWVWNATLRAGLDLSSVHAGGGVDLRGAVLGSLNLSEAQIAGDLSVGRSAVSDPPVPDGEKPCRWFRDITSGTSGGGNSDRSQEAPKSIHWKNLDDKPGDLDLTDAQLGGLVDGFSEPAFGWPEADHLHLSGVTFKRFASGAAERMACRGAAWWEEHWLRRDEKYSPTPYNQLAAAFVLQGHPAEAQEIRFYGKERQRETASGAEYIKLSFLSWLIGYGIGWHFLLIAFWTAVFWLVGAGFLLCAIPKRHCAEPWHKLVRMCLLASLARVLPIPEVNQGFSDWFANHQVPTQFRPPGVWFGTADRSAAAQEARPEPNTLAHAVFIVQAVVGVIFGALIIAAVAGVIQNPS